VKSLLPFFTKGPSHGEVSDAIMARSSSMNHCQNKQTDSQPGMTLLEDSHKALLSAIDPWKKGHLLAAQQSHTAA